MNYKIIKFIPCIKVKQISLNFIRSLWQTPSHPHSIQQIKLVLNLFLLWYAIQDLAKHTVEEQIYKYDFNVDCQNQNLIYLYYLLLAKGDDNHLFPFEYQGNTWCFRLLGWQSLISLNIKGISLYIIIHKDLLINTGELLISDESHLRIYGSWLHDIGISSICKLIFLVYFCDQRIRHSIY